MSFNYLGKEYQWVHTYQGEIDCTCKDCQNYVKSLLRSGYLSIKEKEVVENKDGVKEK